MTEPISAERREDLLREVHGQHPGRLYSVADVKQVAYRLADALERAEAALARVTDDSMQAVIADALHQYHEFQYDECHHGITHSSGPSNGEPFAMCEMTAPSVLRAIRSVAAGPSLLGRTDEGSAP